MIKSSLTLLERLSVSIDNNMAGRQHYPFGFYNLLHCNFTTEKGFIGWLNLGPFIVEYDNNPAWEFISLFTVGKFRIAREMTLEQQEEYQAELAFMEQEANRYTEWSY